MVLVALAAAQGLTALDPRPPAGFDLSAASCEACHREEHAAWERSRHRVAATNAVFSISWGRFPDGWCVNCHAPLAEAQRQALGDVARPGVRYADARPSPLWDEGVSCAACHVEDGAVRTWGEPDIAAEASHPTRRGPDADALCASCHEFPFQTHAQPFGLSDEPAQSTVSEWRSSGTTEGCVDCHDPHAAPGAHDRALVRGAISLALEREGATLVATLSTRGVGHAFPTGDPFRHVDLELCGDAACASIVGKASFRRTFEVTPTSWRLAEDRTVPPSPGSRSLPVALTGPPVWWRLWYRFADRRHEPELPPEEAGYLITEGSFP